VRRWRRRCDVGLESGFLDGRAVAFGEFLAQFVHVRIVFARSALREGRETGDMTAVSYCNAPPWKTLCCEIRSITAAARSQKRRAANRRPDGIWRGRSCPASRRKTFAPPPPGKFCAGLTSSKDHQRTSLGGKCRANPGGSRVAQAQSDVFIKNWGSEEMTAAIWPGYCFEAAFDALQTVEAGDDNIFERVLRYLPRLGNGGGRIGSAVVFGFGV